MTRKTKGVIALMAWTGLLFAARAAGLFAPFGQLREIVLIVMLVVGWAATAAYIQWPSWRRRR